MDIKTRNVERVSSSFCDEVNKGFDWVACKSQDYKRQVETTPFTRNGKSRLQQMEELLLYKALAWTKF